MERHAQDGDPAAARADGAGRRLAVEAGIVAAYVVLAVAATELGSFGELSVWYAPAGLAVAVASWRGWRALPGLALAELLVGALVFGVGPEFGPVLLVVNAVAYTAVLTLVGMVLGLLGGTSPDPGTRRSLLLLGLFLLGPLPGAVVGVGMQLLAGVSDGGTFLADVGLWWLGDTIGLATLVPLVNVTVIRTRRAGGFRWTLPGRGPVASVALALAPAGVAVLLGTVDTGGLTHLALLFPPFLYVVGRYGTPGLALAGLPTSLVVTLVADSAIGPEAVARTDVQVLLLALLLTGLGVAVTVEQRSALRRTLALREQHLRQAQEQAGSGSFVWDVVEDHVEWSDGLHALYGHEPGPVTADDYLLRVHPDDREEVADLLGHTLASGEPYDHVHRAVRADGVGIIVRARATTEQRDGRVVRVLGTCTDVTTTERANQRLAEAVVREQEALLTQQAAAMELEAADRVKQAVLVAVSHQVRTPLTMVRGLAETLRRVELADDRLADHHADLERLEHHAVRLQHVLEDLLDVDRLSRGVVTPVPRPVDVVELCRSVVGDRHAERCRVQVEGEENTSAVLDAGLTSRLVEHLLVNAMRHSDADATVTVTVVCEPDALEVRVDDEGPGIPPEDRERVFVAFEQDSVAAHSPGTGVGLALVARFSEVQGGRAWVTDRDDGRRGASFRVRLPRSVATARR